MSVPSMVLLVLLIAWAGYCEVNIFRRTTKERVKLSFGGGFFYGGGLWLHVCTTLCWLYAIVVDFILFNACLGIMLISNTMHVYVEKEGVVVGGKLYRWDTVEKFSIQPSKQVHAVSKFTVQLKLKTFPWQSHSYLSEKQLQQIKEMGIADSNGHA